MEFMTPVNPVKNGKLTPSEIEWTDPVSRWIQNHQKLPVRSGVALLIFCIISLIFWLILLKADLATRLDGLNIGLITFLLAILFSGSTLFGIVMMTLKKFRHMGLVLFCLSLVIMLFLFTETGVAHNIWTSRINQSIEAGDQIISALENYETVNQRYPAELRELVPVYLTTLPRTSLPEPADIFFYRTEPGSFRLWFPINRKMKWEYQSEGWQLRRYQRVLE